MGIKYLGWVVVFLSTSGKLTLQSRLSTLFLNLKKQERKKQLQNAINTVTAVFLQGMGILHRHLTI
jgi:hypothetical protein